jgi:hypothetical protein
MWVVRAAGAALAVAALVGIVLAVLLLFYTGSAVHFGATGSTWAD